MSAKYKSPRKAISIRIENAVLAKSRRRCTLCFGLDGDVTEKRGQIVHLDRNRNNNAESNLAWMCLDHHSLFDSTTKQHKNYTISEVKEYQRLLYGALRSAPQRRRSSASKPKTAERIPQSLGPNTVTSAASPTRRPLKPLNAENDSASGKEATETKAESRRSAIEFVHRMIDRGSGEERKQIWEQRPDIVLEWMPGTGGKRDKGTFRNIGKRSGFSIKTGSFSWPELQFVAPVQINAIHPDKELTVELPVAEKTGPGSMLVGSLDSFLRDQKFKERDDPKLSITFSDSEGHSFEREFTLCAGPGGAFGPRIITSLGPLRQT